MLEPPTYGSLNRKKDETPVGMMISTEATGLFGMGFTAEQMALEVVVPEKITMSVLFRGCIMTYNNL